MSDQTKYYSIYLKVFSTKNKIFLFSKAGLEPTTLGYTVKKYYSPMLYQLSYSEIIY